jgi:uncharacterized membrane protein YfcA
MYSKPDNHHVDYTVLILMGSGGVIGGHIGARYTNRFSEISLKGTIGLVLTAVAFTMFLSAFQVGTDLLE